MTGRFYDSLAASYDLMFADWDASMAYQASVLGPLVDGRVLDCACGIGTQAIGLALRGHDVMGTDLSPVALARAAREASARGVRLPVCAADMRALPFPSCSFDVVLAADNALPHLLTAAEMLAALREMRRVLRPGGRLVATIRDYDALLVDRPLATPPQVGPGRVVTFQLWHWDGAHYDLEHFQLHEGEEWRTEVRRARYWAITRAEITSLVERAGFINAEWPETPFYQPVLVATIG